MTLSNADQISDRVFTALDNQLKARQLSKRQLAFKLGVAPTTVRRWWERRNMSVWSFVCIMDILEMELHLSDVVSRCSKADRNR